jgi:hypothetical protein
MESFVAFFGGFGPIVFCIIFYEYFKLLFKSITSIWAKAAISGILTYFCSATICYSVTGDAYIFMSLPAVSVVLILFDIFLLSKKPSSSNPENGQSDQSSYPLEGVSVTTRSGPKSVPPLITASTFLAFAYILHLLFWYLG